MADSFLASQFSVRHLAESRPTKPNFTSQTSCYPVCNFAVSPCATAKERPADIPLQYRDRGFYRAARHPKLVLNSGSQLKHIFQMGDGSPAALMTVQIPVDHIQRTAVAQEVQNQSTLARIRRIYLGCLRLLT